MKRILPWLVAATGLFLGAEETRAQCSYTVSPILDFGTVTGLPTPQVDVAATISVTCSSLLQVNRRVCLSIPEGTGGITVADRRMVMGGHSVQYQLYMDPGRTAVWGALGEAAPPLAIDFPLLIGSQTEVATVYGRVFGGQTGQAVGTYQSDLTPIVARWEDFALSAPSCQDVASNASTLSTLPARLTIDTSCTVDANPLDFGSVSDLDGNAASSNLSVTCTLDGPYTVALDGGSVSGDVNDRRMQRASGPETIDYQLYRDSGHTELWGDTPGSVVAGTGTGNAQSIPIFGLVPPQGLAPPGTYQDVITVTVTF